MKTEWEAERRIIFRNEFVKYIIYLGAIVSSYFVFFWPYLTSDYAPMYGRKSASELYAGLDFVTFLTNGRFAYYPIVFVLYGFAKIGVTHLQNAWVMQLVGMMVFALAAFVVFKIYERMLGADEVKRMGIRLDICILLMFINPFMTETYVYGAMDWSIGILIAVFSAKLWMEGHYAWGIITAFFATSYYQSNILIIVVLCLSVYVICGVKEDTLKQKKLICVITCLFGVLICALNVLTQRIAIAIFKPANVAKAVATEDALNILNNVHVFLYQIKIFMITALGFAPKYFVLLLFVLCTFIVVIGLLVKGKAKWQDVIVWIVYCICMATIPFSFRIVGVTGAFGPRTLLSSFFALGGMMLVVIETAIKTNADKRIANTVVCIVVVCFLMYTELGNADCFIQQAIDRNEVKTIYNEIKHYEENTGVTVKNIVSRVDKSPVGHSQEQLLTYTGWVYNHRMLIDDWSQGQYLNCVCGTEYVCRQMTETTYSEIFNDKEWNSFSPSEQLYFQDDTLFWAIY